MPIDMGNSHKIIDWTLDRESIQISSIGLLVPQVNNVLNQAEPGPIFLVPQDRLAFGNRGTCYDWTGAPVMTGQIASDQGLLILFIWEEWYKNVLITDN